MIECRPADRDVLSAETIHSGLVVHLRATSAQCDPWLVIGQDGVDPLFGEEGWRIMEIGEKSYKDFDGKPMGNGSFTGRTSVLRPTHLANFHTVAHE